MKKNRFIPRDISWLAFNNRVLQEAADKTVPLRERIKFLGIVSNNLDEFFRVRVATLKKMQELGPKGKINSHENPGEILESIHEILLRQQTDFEKTWDAIKKELKQDHIYLVNELQLHARQKEFVRNFFLREVRNDIVPLMIESLRAFPVLNDASLYLACTLAKADNSLPVRFALLSIPVNRLPRFVVLPPFNDKKYIILLEDVIRFCLPYVFSFFGYDTFSAHVIKVTRDAEIDMDHDLSTTFIQKIEKGLKNRKKGRPVRFVYDKDINIFLLTYLVKRLGLTKKENMIAGGRIHNFKDFMNFPQEVFSRPHNRKHPFTHPELLHAQSVTGKVLEKDLMLHFPYHSFESVIDLLREAAIDPYVTNINISFYRLAPKSKIIHTLVNAVKNGKQVTVMLELRARFEEAANLLWKNELEEAGVTVLLGRPTWKVHAKICSIRRKEGNNIRHYGFVCTGNLNEQTAKVYGDHCLLTAHPVIMADINRVFQYLENPKNHNHLLKACKKLVLSPFQLRNQMLKLIDHEIKDARNNKPASLTVKLNALSDPILMNKLSEAARNGVEINLIIRGICCMLTENNKFKKSIHAISIIDEYLEHARVFVFNNGGNPKIFISSADWMPRNLDYRLEVCCPVLDHNLKQEMLDMLQIQLSDNTRARILDNQLQNNYVTNSQKPVRSQIETYDYLLAKHTVKNSKVDAIKF